MKEADCMAPAILESDCVRKSKKVIESSSTSLKRDLQREDDGAVQFLENQESSSNQFMKLGTLVGRSCENYAWQQYGGPKSTVLQGISGTYWDRPSIFNCTCGHFLRNGTEENKKFVQYTMDLFSIPNYYIKKGRPHGHRYGKKPFFQHIYHIGDHEYYFLRIHPRDRRAFKILQSSDFNEPRPVHPILAQCLEETCLTSVFWVEQICLAIQKGLTDSIRLDRMHHHHSRGILPAVCIPTSWWDWRLEKFYSWEIRYDVSPAIHLTSSKHCQPYDTIKGRPRGWKLISKDGRKAIPTVLMEQPRILVAVVLMSSQRRRSSTRNWLIPGKPLIRGMTLKTNVLQCRAKFGNS